MKKNSKEIIEKKDIDYIDAEFLKVKHSSVRGVEGSRIEMQQVGALTIDGEHIEVTKSASGIIRGNDVALNQSISAVVTSENTAMNASFAPVVIAKEKAEINKSAVGVAAAMNMKTENSSSVIMIANKVEGNVTTLLDWRGVLAAGAVLGGIFGIMTLLKRR